MFGHVVGPCVRYSYGCLPPVEGGERADEQFRLAHRYRNKLAELEIARRAAIEEILLRDSDVAQRTSEAAALEGMLQEQRERLSELRQQTRTPDPDGAEELGQSIDCTSGELRDAWAALKAARKAAFAQPWAKAAIDQANAAALTAAKAARAASGLYWGTYGTVEQAAQKWRSSPIPPRFFRYQGEGTLGVQCQKGLPADELAGYDTRVRIDPIDWERWAQAPRPEQKRLSRTRLHVRIGSDGRDPIWLVLPIIMHRPLPLNSRIKWVHVIRTKVANRYRYDAQFTVELAPAATPIARGTGSVAIDVGWRLLETGLRVAYWHDDKGQEGELLLPLEHLAQFRKVDDLKGIRERAFNHVRQVFTTWRKAQTSVPPWLTEATKTMHAWHTPARLAQVALRWHRERKGASPTAERQRWLFEQRHATEWPVISPNADFYWYLEAWRRQDLHLWQWEEGQRAKAVAHRREIYRLFARSAAARYAEIRIEKFDLRKVAKRPKPEEGTAGQRRGQTYRQIAAVSTLRSALEEQCAKSGAVLLAVKAVDSTQRCHACGHLQHFDAANYLYRTCSACGIQWDQDENASRNLLVAEVAKQSLRARR